MSVTPSTVLSLWESAGELLAVCEEALSETTAGTPERSYVTPSEPAFDCCPFLSVHVSALTVDTTAVGPGGVATGHRTTSGSIILATYVVNAVRCAPEIADGKSLPTLAAIEAAAQQVEEDGWALWNRVRSAIRCGEIFRLCSEVYFDGGASIPEQGGCVGWQFQVRAALPGIPRDCDEPEPPPTSPYTETDFTDQADGPLTDPWTFDLDLGYPGPIPEVADAVVTGSPGVEGHSVQNVGLLPAYIVGVRLASDWALADPTSAGVSLQLYMPGDSLNYYELRFSPDGVVSGFVVQAGEATEVISNLNTILPIPAGGAFGMMVEGEIMSVLVSRTGDLSSLAVELSNPPGTFTPLPGTVLPAFALHSDVSVDMVFTREPL